MRLMSLVFSVALLAGFAGPAGAQSLGQVVSPILTIDRDALFADTMFGQRVNDQLEAESNALAEETRGIESALEKEERALTVQRETLTPEEFRALADEFDEKVVALRNDRDTAQQNFVQRYEEAQRSFYNQIGPVLGRLMQERGAVAILDKRSVLLSVNAIDVTEEAVERIDEELGDGSDAAATDNPAPALDVTPVTPAPDETPELPDD
ncbi:OmpH family outer membrane protein [Maritimibacter dapengensis]|uniref:OmpH family outer membrane protein n=1 Tax=Maritimibacter dapengensis TaxID=2836868 RepID=A0ABS6T2M0_9RHOB|nr:OmpH family outer membrane protein [Maritimibacter dapengensis]MBV7379494.1 OmpH family outer membrane protein [Maritimibacter dapengensis]